MGWMAGQEQKNMALLGHVNNMQHLSQDILTQANKAALGSTEAFGKLQKARNEMKDHIALLNPKSNNTNPLAEKSEQIPTVLQLAQQSRQYLLMVNVLLSYQQSAETFFENIYAIRKNLFVLQDTLDQILATLLEQSPQPRITPNLVKQLNIVNRMTQNIQAILLNETDPIKPATLYMNELSMLSSELKELYAGRFVRQIQEDSLRNLFENSENLLIVVENRSENLSQLAEQRAMIRSSLDSINNSRKAIEHQSRDIISHHASSDGFRFFGFFFGMLLGLVTIILLGLLIYHIYSHSKEHMESLRNQQAQQQQAIEKLLHELAYLADGDLTISASQNSRFTSSIAKSFNYAINALRNLVMTINQTAVRISNTVEKGNTQIIELEGASTDQSKQIMEVTKSVNDMALSIEQVSSNAIESSTVSEQSVHIARKGVEVVQDSIVGMDSIRARIQETSKRIKRLGESSQEIGNIVSLITDIADQTNLLALNAAIQAAMAGESEQGFATVADEVQRLAASTSNAANKIEVLVNTIQTDTLEAVSSMEHSTAQVVEGAKRAHDAGIALAEIEKVSKNLANLIQEISNEAGQQARTASAIAKTMGTIQDITTHTAGDIKQTTGAITKLTGLAGVLRLSVSGFKLPT